MKNLTIPVCRIYFEQIKSGEKTDTEKRIAFPWHGYLRKTITHKHFGDYPVKVYAIRLEK